VERERRWWEVLWGVVAVTAIGLVLVAPGWVLDLGIVAMAAGVLTWISRCLPEHIVSPRGLPRPMVFGLLGAGIAANLSTVRFFDQRGIGRMGLTLSLVVLVIALIVGLARVGMAHPVRRS